MYLTLSTLNQGAVEEICVLGFKGNFEDYLTSYARRLGGQELNQFESSFKAFQWLEETAEKQDKSLLPKAVICDYTFLKGENFLFARNLRNHTTLRMLPFIVICREQCFEGTESLDLGVDDCYQFPVSWGIIEARIDFLKKYKSQYQSTMDIEEKIPDFKIPQMKRVFDVFMALATIVLLSPLLLIIAIAIKLESKGPVIYSSNRVGTGYQVFDFLKFRSMRQNADQEMKTLQHLNQYDDDNKKGKGPLFVKFVNDPRVTRVGRLIRKTSLDEMPQLLNVLKGEMSIVGNRPLPLYEAKELTQDAWAMRFLAPAGCTGLWQVSKRGRADMSSDERIELDIEYAKNYSFWYDLRILLKTLPALIQKENV
ncbi:MAG: lipopolysaccharide/colanic/teichoic acid biosynthesis glycosyltransferase [Paraglaciecola sp.]|jgi:lipopolysaccharide/colanic/teichoic acid biosynthesis glycosyltransferase